MTRLRKQFVSPDVFAVYEIGVVFSIKEKGKPQIGPCARHFFEGLVREPADPFQFAGQQQPRIYGDVFQALFK